MSKSAITIDHAVTDGLPPTHPGEILHWVTDLGWIMGPWEIVGALALGSTVLLTEGAPTHPGPDRLWATVERHGVTTLGVSPTLIRLGVGIENVEDLWSDLEQALDSVLE